MGKALLIVLIVLAVVASPAASQEQEKTPEEFQEQEFSPFWRSLRRAEIIALGTFPLTIFLAIEAYDFYRYASSGWDATYAPWPFRTPDADPYTKRENLGVLLSAVTVSLLIATADLVIGRIKERRAEEGGQGTGRGREGHTN